MRHRRLASRLVRSALLATLLVVLAGYALAYRGERIATSNTFLDASGPVVWELSSGFGWARLDAGHEEPEPDAKVYFGTRLSLPYDLPKFLWGEPKVSARVPAWSVVHNKPPEWRRRCSALSERAFGFPFVWLRYSVAEIARPVGGGTVKEYRGFRHLWSSSRSAWGDGGLPYHVSAPHLASSILCVAACLHGLGIAVSALRTRLRASAGECQRCRYELEGLPTLTCPECGHAAR